MQDPTYQVEDNVPWRKGPIFTECMTSWAYEDKDPHTWIGAKPRTYFPLWGRPCFCTMCPTFTSCFPINDQHYNLLQVKLYMIPSYANIVPCGKDSTFLHFALQRSTPFPHVGKNSLLFCEKFSFFRENRSRFLLCSTVVSFIWGWGSSYT